MKIAAYQAPLLPCGSMESLDLIRKQIDRCQSEGVDILCCPEAILGGLADYAERPTDFAINVDGGQLNTVLAPLASDTVTTILGFTEITRDGDLFNSAAIFHRGSVLGVYRKLYPAIRKSVYRAGEQMPIFQVGGLKFGIIICLDSNYIEPARVMASRGATALFVPTNNGLPPEKAEIDLPVQTRNVDIARAIDNTVSVIRADVAGRTENLVSYGTSEIVDPDGMVLQSAQRLREDLIVADIEASPL
jgi:predicted amidohydrolase